MTEFAVVVMNGGFWLYSEKSVSKLMLRPVEGRKWHCIDMHIFSAFELHDDEDGKHGEFDRILGAKAARPYCVCLVFKKGPP